MSLIAQADVHPIAQDGVIIGQLEDFIELMRDKQDRFAVLLQTLNDVIKLEDFMLGKRGGRLIEDHHRASKASARAIATM